MGFGRSQHARRPGSATTGTDRRLSLGRAVPHRQTVDRVARWQTLPHDAAAAEHARRPAVCWGAFVLTWIAGAIYNDSRAPAAERTRTWFPRTGWVIVAVARGGRWIAHFPVFLVILEIKIRVEERLMLAEFPDAYPRYRQRVPKLVPGLRLFSSRSVVSG